MLSQCLSPERQFSRTDLRNPLGLRGGNPVAQYNRSPAHPENCKQTVTKVTDARPLLGYCARWHG